MTEKFKFDPTVTGGMAILKIDIIIRIHLCPPPNQTIYIVWAFLLFARAIGFFKDEKKEDQDDH